jgi:hypothetical protein
MAWGSDGIGFPRGGGYGRASAASIIGKIPAI